MHASVGHLAGPVRQVGVQGLQGVEAVAGDGIALDVYHPALVLALGARLVRRAGPRGHASVAAESVKAVVELHLAGLRGMRVDQAGGVVDQQFFGDSLEVPQRPFEPLQHAVWRSCRNTAT